MEDLKRQWSQKGRGREGCGGVICLAELQEKEEKEEKKDDKEEEEEEKKDEEEEESTAGSMLGPAGLAGRQHGPIAPNSQDPAPGEGDGRIGMGTEVHSQSPLSAPADANAVPDGRRFLVNEPNRPQLCPYPSCLHGHSEQQPHP